jgi:hypothetical protein
LIILETSKRLTITAPPEESSDLVVVAEERDEKVGASVLKDESQITVAPAFEQFVSKLADTKAAVHVGLTKTINQIAESKETFYPFVLWQVAQAADDRWIDGKKLTQASS